VLAHKPEVVILDDPCLALDPIMRSEFNRELVTHLHGRGSTVLYSSHLLAEVEAVADSVAILHGGRIARHADVDELRSDVKRLIVPLQEFTLVADRLRLLDVRVNGPEVAAIVDDCGSALRLFAIEGVEARTDDLTLDEIFAAFVTGRAEFETLAPAVKSAPEGGVP
jgi:ABC-2 type transport system ATP-binding protein